MSTLFRSLINSLLFTGMFILPGIATLAQQKDTARTKKADSAQVLAKLLVKPDALKPYQEIITPSAKTGNGFFKVHNVDDRYYFEIPDSIMSRDLLVVNRISKSPADLPKFLISPGYAGDEIGNNVIQFERVPGNKIMLKVISYNERASDSSENGLYRSFVNSNQASFQAAFPVKSLNKENPAVVIDVTDYLNTDNTVFGFGSFYKMLMPLVAALPDRSYIQQVRAFPVNIEIKTVKTYLTKPYPNGVSIPPITFELNSSIVLLPKVPMKSRQTDARLGYISTSYIDYDANPQGITNAANISRWRMEPKPEDKERYRRGELVEPAKPIIIYIDPNTPRKWIPYLIQGINDWQVAFEKAGFKHAIMGKEVPANDTTWSLEDARHSFVVYKPSNISNATGPSIIDPRSGEILETHINWYHNVMDLLYKWYFIQAGAVDPLANKPRFSDSLMGQLIRFVSSHEVGHTLGLHHNFGASSTVPVENLRNKAWVEAHGHTPSIMDYARFNYVAQPEDHIAQQGIFPRIGDYDKWAIEWGYKLLPEGIDAEQEKATLNKWIVDKLASGKQYYFGRQGDALDPRGQNEDLGDDAMKAGAYGIKNLKRVMPNLVKWTTLPDDGYNKTDEMYQELLSQYTRYIFHVVKNIGGVNTTPKSIEEAGPAFDFVTKEKQKRAVAFLQDQLFDTPQWLMSKQLFSLTGKADYAGIAKVQDGVLSQLLSNGKLTQLLYIESIDPGNAYTAEDMLEQLKDGIFSELPAHKKINMYRRNLQKMYVEKLLSLIPSALNQQKGAASRDNDALTIVKAHARQLHTLIKRSIPLSTDHSTRIHLEDLAERLDISLQVGNR